MPHLCGAINDPRPVLEPHLATRDAALSAMKEFAPRMGRRYANGRNYDRGAGQHRDVSSLSPWVRRRLVTEKELIATALKHHGPEEAEKFIQEVIWRSYFKGWLERRPSIWSDYVAAVQAQTERAAQDRKLRKQLADAEAGQTGLDCFDAWARELVDTGYLHNHARMWFASIWIFTFGLPWQMGADFFYRHLLDGDPASNTCSWRWVAGLHTRGKFYEAKAWNIAKFTENRFAPRDTDLAVISAGLQDCEPHGLPEVQPLRSVIAPQSDRPTALLLTEEDCSVADFDPTSLDIVCAARLSSSHLRSPSPTSDRVAAFEATALADTAVRLGIDTDEMTAGAPSDLARWCTRAGATQIAMPYVTTGPLSDWMAQARPSLDASGITVTEWRHDWDELIWPNATAGFFKVKKAIPNYLHKAGLT